MLADVLILVGGAQALTLLAVLAFCRAGDDGQIDR
jgi:hypothetical protein